ncbi:hypothetical protein HPB48_012193 [Haemaphysalis longicornis]|uniref:Major facilitator superfamily (MFS) profile domain-containing protein n=1 Tax=Haemaphysalis longicornis TaxID=44386 RepID=A0A9J6GQX5_HAELO|nr:hypothetical protein HPB48_012193 [Haemaphysalis longicornis]
MSLGAVFGCLAGAPLTQLCGRRWSFVGASLFLIASWLTVVRVQQTFFLYTARFVTGFFTGLISLIVPAHIAEMAVATKRGSHVSVDTGLPWFAIISE